MTEPEPVTRHEKPAVTVDVETLLGDPPFGSPPELSSAFVQPVTMGQDETLHPNLDIAMAQALIWRS
ncbi:hypothetical protein C8P66_13420 [Humitalea rosea]|uniref:Uncharacterized protein n=1 Tax=Humitalea rosea TaxID=990373 RepID=A0A2W7HVQ0_9PROT|nr:hypothetical protein C8P66_13420 [Humitalea rosea]